jgi:hypothetical protein
MRLDRSLEIWGLRNRIAPANSLLAENLQTILKLIKEHYKDAGQPKIRNVLLYFYRNPDNGQLPQKAGYDFDIVFIDYSKELTGSYIKL